MNKQKLITTVLIVAIVSMAAIGGISAETDDLPFPGVELYITADVDVYDSESRGLEIGDSGTFLDGTVWKKVRPGVLTLEISIILEAPILYQSWRDYSNDPSVGFFLDDDINIASEPLDDEIPVAPSDNEEADKDWGFENFFGQKSYEVKNETNDIDLSAHDITDNFETSSAPILLIENAFSTASGNSTVKVSYSTASGGNITAAAETGNITIFNDVLVSADNYWWNLELENTNTTRDYVINVYINNLSVDGFFIFDCASTSNITDTRYTDIYLDNSETPTTRGELNTLGLPGDMANWEVHEGIKRSTGDAEDAIALAGLWSSITSSKILSKPTKLLGSLSSKIEARGWSSATDLIKDCKNGFVRASAKIPSLSSIADYTIKTGKLGWMVGSELSAATNSALKVAAEKTSNLRTAVKEAKEKTISTISVGFNTAASKIKETGKSVANGAKDVSNGFVAAAKNAGGKVTSFASGIKDGICDVSGKIVNGAVSAVGKVWDTATGLFGSIPMIIVAVAVLGIVGLVVYVKFIK
ncbi:MAG: hypothetical protein ACTSYA_01670 [Candidatus Kariarchaeaceae archaeon]